MKAIATNEERYIHVDIDGPVVKVYGSPQLVEDTGFRGRDFIKFAQDRESRRDVCIDDPVTAAREYAAKQAKRYKCNWGDNS